MERPLKILLLEDSRDDAEIIRHLLLKKMRCEFRLVMNKNNFINALEEFSPEVILSDNSLPQFDAIEALRATRQKHRHVPFILVTGTVSEKYAANIMKGGADDFIMKDRMARLPAAIITALNLRQAEKEKEEAVENLRLSEEKYRTIFYKSPLPKWIYDCETLQFLEVNESAIQHYGYTKEEFLSMSIKDIRLKEDIGLLMNVLREIPNERSSRQGLWRHLKKNGELITVETTAHSIEYDNRKARMMVINDVTEKIKVEQQVLQNQMRFKQAQAITHMGNWEIDFEENTSRWSDEAYRIYGLTPGDHNLSVTDWISFVHPEDIEYVKEILERSLAELTDLAFDHRIVRKDGTVRYVHSESKFEFNREGKAVGLYGIAHDITDKKKLEEEIVEQQKNEQLKVTAATLEAQERERNAIGAELHDNINQILVGTNLILSLAKNNSGNAKGIVTSAMEHILQAINENRKIAHELATPDFDARKLSDRIRDLADLMLKTSGIAVDIDTSRLADETLGEEQKLAIYRIAQEQCSNIVKYAKAKKVSISLSTDRIFKMIIIDDGVGMRKNKNGEGIGLGNIKGRLSIVNGTVKINTAPGEGFILQITIPLGKQS